MLGQSQKISNSSAADSEQIRKLLTSPEGQELIKLLQADGGAGVRAAAASIQSGNMEAARSALLPLLDGTKAEELTRKMEEKL